MSQFAMRLFRAGDEASIMMMYDQPHVAGMVMRPHPDRIAAALADGELELQLVCSGEELVGLILLARELPWLCCIRQLIAKREREGIGTFAMWWALRRIFEEHRAHRAYLEVKARNVGARALYERLGFVYEGTWRDGTVGPVTGSFEDLCAYGMLEDEYRARNREH